MCQHLTIARVAEGLGVAWNTANDAVLAEGKRVLINDENRFDGVNGIGVDEHVWRHTRRGDKFVTVIVAGLSAAERDAASHRPLGRSVDTADPAFQAQWPSGEPGG